MADTALQNAEKRRDELAAEINQLQHSLEQKRKEMERVKVFIDDYASFAAGSLFPWVKQVSAEKQEKHVNPDKLIVGDAVEKILRLNGRPMSRDDLFAAVKQEGLDIRGKDPRMVLSTMLWRMQDRFVRFSGKGGYWLKWEACPAVNYYPPPPPLPAPPY